MITIENVVTGVVGLSVIGAAAVAFAMARTKTETSLAAQVLPLTLETIIGAVLLLGAFGGPGFQFQLPGSGQASVTPNNTVLPTRMAAGPGQFPPKQFRAYGIVAFKTRPTPADRDRYDMVCDAYVSSLAYYKDVSAPLGNQMVTVWPVETASWADRINGESRQKVCTDAVPHYGLASSLEAIDSAKKNGAALDGQGPFLMAWSPGSAKGQPDALVLVADMSDIINNEQSKQIFAQWALDIQNDSSLWDPTWNMEKLTLRIRLWADKWGTRILNTYKSKS
jgi:hypothetical protein